MSLAYLLGSFSHLSSFSLQTSHTFFLPLIPHDGCSSCKWKDSKNIKKLGIYINVFFFMTIMSFGNKRRVSFYSQKKQYENCAWQRQKLFLAFTKKWTAAKSKKRFFWQNINREEKSFLFYQLKMLLDVDVIKNYNDIFGVSLLFISPKRIEWYTGFNQGQV